MEKRDTSSSFLSYLSPSFRLAMWYSLPHHRIRPQAVQHLSFRSVQVLVVTIMQPDLRGHRTIFYQGTGLTAWYWAICCTASTTVNHLNDHKSSFSCQHYQDNIFFQNSSKCMKLSSHQGCQSVPSYRGQGLTQTFYSPGHHIWIPMQVGRERWERGNTTRQNNLGPCNSCKVNTMVL